MPKEDSSPPEPGKVGVAKEPGHYVGRKDRNGNTSLRAATPGRLSRLPGRPLKRAAKKKRYQRRDTASI